MRRDVQRTFRRIRVPRGAAVPVTSPPPIMLPRRWAAFGLDHLLILTYLGLLAAASLTVCWPGCVFFATPGRSVRLACRGRAAAPVVHGDPDGEG